MTDKIYRKNPQHEPRRLRQKIQDLLEVERRIVIPPEPGDVLGHADGVVPLAGAAVLLFLKLGVASN